MPGGISCFAVIGDTEARPHINDVIAKAVWGERPNFLVHVGDLTDGGQQHHKFEWNLEDFAPTRNWFSTKLHRGHHYCILNVFAGQLRFQMFDSEGRLRDLFELNKE